MFCENSLWLLVVSYFRKTFRLRCLTRLSKMVRRESPKNSKLFIFRKFFTRKTSKVLYLSNIAVNVLSDFTLRKKWSFLLKNFFQQMWANPQFPADLVAFVEEMLNRALSRIYFTYVLLYVLVVLKSRMQSLFGG